MRPGRRRSGQAPAGPPERLHKALARVGVGSRREVEQWIRAGRISVNGEQAQIGQTVTPRDAVRVDGRRVTVYPPGGRRARVIRYHKPAGEVCTRRDEQGRATVFDALPGAGTGRWVMVGRLDLNTSGLLLFTDDGGLANRLMHPSGGLEREYAVRVLGAIPPDALRRLREGVALDDGPARFERVDAAGGDGANRWYHCVLREGRNREVRRLWEAVDATVSRLIRVRYGPVRLPPWLRPGRWEELPAGDRGALLAAAGGAKTGPVRAPGRR